MINGLIIGYGILTWLCLVLEKGEEAAHGAAEESGSTAT
ncbi:hypothetical protein 40AC_63 [Mycobacterium phage 40AC]|uniref:Uncharacterized protein n=1 Tax=Mycobacterium phage 40AC TaxID=1458717 RepID=W8EGE3_9CAUD|nr:hypothetical protein ST40AC_63 [Mycobacterium phage 40AC]AHJ86426.1 hypothetical protein 40AC_63 [Mycobacterium phage 40AC]